MKFWCVIFIFGILQTIHSRKLVEYFDSFENTNYYRSSVPGCTNCSHGECDMGICNCHRNFIKVDGNCIFWCAHHCGIHGDCTKDHKICKCDFGYTGKHCDKPNMYVLRLDSDDNLIKTKRIIENYNSQIRTVLMNNPEYPENVIHTLKNETLCYDMSPHTKYITKLRIGCLMDGEYLQFTSQHKVQTEYNGNGIIIGLGILILTGAVATYILIQKYRNRQRNQVARHISHTIRQTLIEEEDY